MRRRPHPIMSALARLRLGCRDSQTAVAKAIDTHQSAIALWENGRRDPSIFQVDAYAREYGLRLALVRIPPEERQS